MHFIASACVASLLFIMFLVITAANESVVFLFCFSALFDSSDVILFADPLENVI